MARRHNAIAVLFISANLLVTFSSSPVLAETLLDALLAANDANPALAAERERQRATGETLPQAFAEGLPSVSASLDAGRTEEQFSSPDSVASRNPNGFSIEASVPLFRGFQTYNGVRSARAMVRAGDQRLSATSQQLFANVATAYADVRKSRQVVRLRNQNVRFLTSELAATRKRKNAGDKSRTDVAQAEARRQEAKAELSEASADLVESEARYASLVGRIPGKLEPVILRQRLLPPTLDEAIALADARSPVIAAARADAKAADHQARVRKGALLPTVSLEASYENRSEDSLSFAGREETSVIAKLTIPLFEGGARLSRMREANSQSIARHYDFAQARSVTAASVATAFRRRLAATDRIAASKSQMRAARTALRGVRLEAEVGQRSVLDILDAQRERINAEIAVVTAERDLVVASFRLLAEIGIADPATIAGSPVQSAAGAQPGEALKQMPDAVFGRLRSSIFN